MAAHGQTSKRGNNTLLLFGALVQSHDVSTLRSMRESIVVQHGEHSWLVDSIKALPQDFEAALPHLPFFDQATTTTIHQLLVDAVSSFLTGSFETLVSPLPAALLIPLAVATQLAHYVEYSRQSPTGLAEGKEALGFCTGILSAFAVASSHDVCDLAKYGAAAMRLGMLVGLVVDCEDAAAGQGRYRSVSAGWDSEEKHAAMLKIVQSFEEAYVSVHFDKNRATITTSPGTISNLTRQLQKEGLVASDMGLLGRFHFAGSTKPREVTVDQLVSFCNSPAGALFRLPDADSLRLATRINDRDGGLITQGSLHEHALQSILVKLAAWFETFSSATTTQANTGAQNGRARPQIVDFGPQNSVPHSLASTVDINSGNGKTRRVKPADAQSSANSTHTRPWLDTDIAIVGMSCKVPGAENLEEFWDLLVSGKSQHQEISGQEGGRFDFGDTAFRTAADQRRRWFANLVSNHDQFDHRFFKKSARESASMDPQQRHILQVAYQAVEGSGYFNKSSSSTPTNANIGCYVGLCLGDYESNVASHPATAFTATGNLQGFVSGKVSHYFGWTGPAVTVNTACSSSLVAVHLACQAILSGECEAALAGGSHIMTSATWFQNLAGGSFLSPTGACKPFDSKADGYCRGEGVGAVFLKRMSQAMADGDMVLGVVAATGVQQNQNCTPIFVPNAPSLENLFSRVMTKARVKPADISVVEGHGTGTAVGDPAEYDAIRKALGGTTHRSADKPLMLSSVKGLVGHMECTSGVIGMIKLLLMMNKGALPPQASFQSINPALGATPADHMFIPTRPQPWVVPAGGFRAALLNNYGASGSNASAVLVQSPSMSFRPEITVGSRPAAGIKFPFWLAAFDKKSLSRYVKALRKWLCRLDGDQSLASLSFNLARQSNRTMQANLVLTARSIEALDQSLADFENGNDGSFIERTPASSQPTVILCFGGQVSCFVGLDKQVYQDMALVRYYLDRVDAVIQCQGGRSIFPGIFNRSPPSKVDIVHLHTMLFAMQYASARCWIDSGVKPAALVGHSFGTLTALCISGILSLEDTIKAIMCRAKLLNEAWGPDQGGMIAVEGDIDVIEELLDEANKNHDDKPATIACYNGPTSFTLAGSTTAMDAVAAQLKNGAKYSKGMKSKRIYVTHAFHSVLVDPLLEELTQRVADSGVRFRKPIIPVELSTEQHMSESELTSEFMANHMRQPVYFHHAVERLARRYAGGSSPCVFLEAGTNSSVCNMASRALGSTEFVTKSSSLSFHGVNIANCDAGWNKLTDTTVNLWETGVRVHHWAHHGVQQMHQTDIKPLLVPPYQFDPDSRHWIDLKVPRKALMETDEADAGGKKQSDAEKLPETILTFHSSDAVGAQKQARFRVNTMLEEYKQLLRGHMTLETAPILSATLQINLVIEAISSTQPEYKSSKSQPQIQDVVYQSPVCFNSANTLWVEVTNVSGQWMFQVFSTTTQELSPKSTRMVHTKGTVAFKNPGDAEIRRQLMSYERLFSHGRATDLLQNSNASTAPIDEMLGNQSIYRIFSEIVSYGPEFRGLQKMVSRGNETAGHVVHLKHQDSASTEAEPWFDPHLADTFCQLGGLWVNCMMPERERGNGHVYLANGIDQWIRGYPAASTDRPEAFNVFAVNKQASEQLTLTDVFVFNAADGALVEVILGIAYVKIARPSMEKLLARLTEPSWVAGGKTTPQTATKPAAAPVVADHTPRTTESASTVNGVNLDDRKPEGTALPQEMLSDTEELRPKAQGQELQDMIARVKAVMADISGLDISEIKDDSNLADLGIDSLVGMEMTHEIESTLKVELPESEIMSVVDMEGLLQCVAGALGLSMTGASSDTLTASSDSGINSAKSSILSGTSTSTSTGTTDTGSDVGQSMKEPSLMLDTVKKAFAQTKEATDARIKAASNQVSYCSTSLPQQNELSVLLTITALEALGAGFSTARPGSQLTRISHAPGHEQFVTHLYKEIETATQIIKIDGHGAQAVITRTAVPLPDVESRQVALCEQMLRGDPEQVGTMELIKHAGENLHRVLSGETDGAKVIFGSKTGSKLVSQWYAQWPLNRSLIAQMGDFLTAVVAGIQADEDMPFSEINPLRIMETGAGTGGTTKQIVPLLARLGLPVVYTFTDLAPSFVAAARKTWGKEYPWMQFRTLDMEKTPPSVEDGLPLQHFIVSANAVHATKSISATTGNLRKALRTDGFLLMMEMTRTPFWVDLIFGLFEGWWLFEDGRKHALTHEALWDQELSKVGFGYVDWTEGMTAESEIQKIILASADANTRLERVRLPASHTDYHLNQVGVENEARELMVADYVSTLTKEFNKTMTQYTDAGLSLSSRTSQTPMSSQKRCILITGGTGGLGAHLVAEAALLPDVNMVICLNRPNRKQEARERQLVSLEKKGLILSPEALAKITVFETDLSQPGSLGLSDDKYNLLRGNVTHIIHNAWLMHSKWPVRRFEPQLRIMAHMLNLAADIATCQRTQGQRQPGPPVSFVFVSSIATVGYHPVVTNPGNPAVPETRIPISSVLPTGYGEAKYICERMLDATLHQYPAQFRASAVRLGQIAGSEINGHWNSAEHISFLVKSSQSIGALPALPGPMGWTPADYVARGLVEIATQPDNIELYPIYHIENPVRQPWDEALAVLADEMGISSEALPFQEWVQTVRDWPRQGDNTAAGANPAYLLVDFLEDHFLRMSCGGLLLGTAKAREHSPSLAGMGPVSDELLRLFVRSWKEVGFLL
uniref:3-methylorcinaldehyde synthase n=1 Tax=Sarocladium schorii TaxID=2203296 RepID=PKS1_SARSH|nr:RecName: Full=3-methylorcinaldehyde synthase; Short=MOS; AltName: Full=Non-reducing polyketide synthase 1; AltName: Full=Xenovulene A biosynthesis cluster protein aspks1 [Sarocladium sp. 'schorii']AFD18255.1 PKS1 [Sarocladium strictum]AWM95789.1 non-reduciing polyketide synthase methylorcinaldehyde synthase [Sarocladium sp. 'schorii']CAN87161.2 methylorcinaldehyde synthase [Sarocladium strictum]